MLEKSAGKLAEVISVSVTDVREAADLLQRIGGKERPVKSAIERATNAVARFIPKGWTTPMGEAKWHYGRAEDIWREQVPGIWSTEMDAIRRAADERAAQEARNEFREITNRIARLEAAMGVQDPEFGGPHLDALRASVGRPDRPVGGGDAD